MTMRTNHFPSEKKTALHGNKLDTMHEIKLCTIRAILSKPTEKSYGTLLEMLIDSQIYNCDVVEVAEKYDLDIRPFVKMVEEATGKKFLSINSLKDWYIVRKILDHKSINFKDV
jgi:hypothetical protein